MSNGININEPKIYYEDGVFDTIAKVREEIERLKNGCMNSHHVICDYCDALSDLKKKLDEMEAGK